MNLFDKLGGQQMPQTPQAALQQLQQNPQAMIRQAGMSIPDGMTDPQQMVQHLLQSGQVPQARYQQAVQMMQRMK